jgi:hypothetical protein
MTGFNLPPGCTTRHIDEAAGVYDICEACGKYCEECICPECPVCSSYGDKRCYKDATGDLPHVPVLEFTNQQLIGQAKLRIGMLKEQIQDEEMYIAYLEENDEVCDRCNIKIRPEGGHHCGQCGRNV